MDIVLFFLMRECIIHDRLFYLYFSLNYYCQKYVFTLVLNVCYPFFSFDYAFTSLSSLIFQLSIINLNVYHFDLLHWEYIHDLMIHVLSSSSTFILTWTTWIFSLGFTSIVVLAFAIYVDIYAYRHLRPRIYFQVFKTKTCYIPSTHTLQLQFPWT